MSIEFTDRPARHAVQARQYGDLQGSVYSVLSARVSRTAPNASNAILLMDEQTAEVVVADINADLSLTIRGMPERVVRRIV